ncbi:MAG: hypothetical protein UU21_C0006G0001 [Candidatus Levybacteria bacterium GW2011_GWA2_40_8]|nr:MAG: hypothetical protein UU21_C0006G0001 [Candidatus Levybacteria bacterium GW2011_GWA2_40_8]
MDLSIFSILLIVLVIGVIYAWYQKINRFKTIMEKLAKDAAEAEKRPGDKELSKELWNTYKIFNEMNETYIKLKERFRHDKVKRDQVEQDWRHFLEFHEKASKATGGPWDPDWDTAEESHAKMHEIERRFDNLLKD